MHTANNEAIDSQDRDRESQASQFEIVDGGPPPQLGSALAMPAAELTSRNLRAFPQTSGLLVLPGAREAAVLPAAIVRALPVTAETQLSSPVVIPGGRVPISARRHGLTEGSTLFVRIAGEIILLEATEPLRATRRIVKVGTRNRVRLGAELEALKLKSGDSVVVVGPLEAGTFAVCSTSMLDNGK